VEDSRACHGKFAVTGLCHFAVAPSGFFAVTSPLAGIIAAATFRTGCGHQVDHMTVGAGATVVFRTVSFPKVGMWTSVGGRVLGGGVVTLVARRTSKQADVERRVGVTGRTGGWGTLENKIDMATDARHAGTCTGQLEAGQSMIEGYRQPAAGGMTGTAIRAELTIVKIILLVTGVAVLVWP
jgi:hypothetical protein